MLKGLAVQLLREIYFLEAVLLWALTATAVGWSVCAGAIWYLRRRLIWSNQFFQQSRGNNYRLERKDLQAGRLPRSVATERSAGGSRRGSADRIG
jgi:hypothetical protein